MVLHEIPLTDTTKILITKDTINEKTFGQVRVWTKPKDNDEYIPTKKGIAVNPKILDEVVEMMLEAGKSL